MTHGPPQERAVSPTRYYKQAPNLKTLLFPTRWRLTKTSPGFTRRSSVTGSTQTLPLAGRAHRLFSPDPQAAAPQLLFFRLRRKKESSSVQFQPEFCCPRSNQRIRYLRPRTIHSQEVRAYRPGTSNYVPESSALTATSPKLISGSSPSPAAPNEPAGRPLRPRTIYSQK